MDVVGIIGLIIAPVSSVISWIFGTRSRRNTVYQELLTTIKTLSEQNAAYSQKIVDLQNEVIEVRRENAELKAGQEELTREIQELKKENQELKTIITKKKK